MEIHHLVLDFPHVDPVLLAPGHKVSDESIPKHQRRSQ